MQLDASMKKAMFKMLLFVGILFGVVFIYKVIGGFAQKYRFSAGPSPVTVSAMQVQYSEWPSALKAVGSLRTVLGVDITTELAGMIKNIYFKPGGKVKANTVLVQLNADTEIGDLHALEAQMALARITYYRDRSQYLAHAISKQTLDSDQYNYENLIGQVESQAATTAKKTLRAPFTGQLGISDVNPGQYLNVGDKVVTLETLDPIYIDFFVPQQMVSQLKINQMVSVSSDAFPKQTFSGAITTIEPAADTSTRNVKVEATVSNPNYLLLPGMFGMVDVSTGPSKKILTLPQTAVSFNPYGNIVYILKQTGKDKNGNTIFTATQSFVITGEQRGDQVAILKGVKTGDMIVTSGQLKLKNGSRAYVNNTVTPSDNPAPNLPNEH